MAKRSKPIDHEERRMNRAFLAVALLITMIILFGLAGYAYANVEDLDTRTGLVGDPICGNLGSQDAQDACCAEGHEGEPVPDCVGFWSYDPEEQSCSFLCGFPAYADCTEVADTLKTACCQNKEGNQDAFFNEETDQCEQITLPSPLEQQCFDAGGEWREFPNGCVDSCDLARNPETTLCTQALTFGCDCGPSECFNQNTGECERNSG